MHTISVDLSRATGRIKPLHGVCCAPYVISGGSEQSYVDRYLREGNIPFCRLHDCCYPYGGGVFVDIPNIFPDFSADENDPASYHFYYTDEYIAAIERSGCKTYYRLGVSIEWGSLRRATAVPPDFAKWARICEHIIRHYNEGWAQGFRYGIEYWEIWNEPENPGNQNGPSMWAGTKEEFFSLYCTASKYLKACFPSIRIGGYGSCGFYSLTRTGLPEGYAAFLPYFTDFLAAVRAEGCPLDFFSWHIYTKDVQEILTHARFVRETLDAYGFPETESHLNEWNYSEEGGGFAEKHTATAAAFNAAVFAALQSTDYVDHAMYYCFSYTGRYNGLLNQNDGSTEIPWYAFCAFGRLYALGRAASVSGCGDGLYAVCASDGGRAAILVSDYGAEDGAITLNIGDLGGRKTVRVRLIDSESPLDEKLSVQAEGRLVLSLSMKRDSVLLLEAE